MSCRCVRWQSMLRRFWSRYAETSTRVVISASGRPNPSSSSNPPLRMPRRPRRPPLPRRPWPMGAGCQVWPSRRTFLPALSRPGELVEALDGLRTANERGVRLARDPRRVDVVGMAIVAVLVVRHDRRWACPRTISTSRPVATLDIGLPEGVGMGVGIGPHHSRVAIPEQVLMDGATPEGVERAGQLRGADGRQPRSGLLRVQRRIVDLSLGAIGAGDEIDADALGHEPRDAATGSDALVVGVGVDERTPPVSGGISEASASPMPANARRASRSPMAASSAMCPNCSAFAFPNRGEIRRSGASTTTGSA